VFAETRSLVSLGMPGARDVTTSVEDARLPDASAMLAANELIWNRACSFAAAPGLVFWTTFLLTR
jgi:hypothetical protein